MKKNLLLVFALLCSFFLKAQEIDKQTALQIVAKNSSVIGLSADEINNSLVSNAYYDNLAGIKLIYLQQGFQGIPVYNQLMVLAFKNESLVSKSGSFISSIGKRVNVGNGLPAMPATAAVMTALGDRKLTAKQDMFMIRSDDNGRKITFNDMGISRENITAQLMWVPTEKAGIRLAWQVYIIPTTTSDYWQIRVDASDNRVLDMNNLTVYCNWDSPLHQANTCDKEHRAATGTNSVQQTQKISLFTGKLNKQQDYNIPNSPAIINSATYRVIPFPAESPIHPGGTPAVKVNPWLAAPGNATSLKWHSTGTNDYNFTRGNNVWAVEDRDGNNGTTGLSAISSTSSDPLSFDFTPNFTVNPTQVSPVPNQQFNITNLFYWNNIIHDLTYLYGFDEVSGNFQSNNQGRGGAGNDFVLADAQDGGGTNNANFSTPADGSSGRMQMYLWSGSPQKDGDVDNGVVVHEYAHGISNRLTGGPAQSGCLSNAEQMGEGWSDYYGLMYTQDWANSNVNTGFNTPRGIGTYVVGQTVNGTGIRSQKYCTNFSVNNKVYATNISGESHNRGEIWCAVLWDMTWNIINQVNSINPNIFDPAGGGGNTIALKLVTEGMKLQPCSPGFIDGRDAILQADQILYGGLYSCAIREAFRRRGMGAFASQGSSSSVNDQVADFSSGSANFGLTQAGVTQVNEGQNITYTNTVSNSPCAVISNFLLTDTLPTNVTYVSGGTYNATTRVVSFPVNLAAGETQAYSFTVNVNAGSYYPTVTVYEDPVSGTTIPAAWTNTSTTSTIWEVSNARSHSAPSSYYSFNRDIQSDQRLFSTNAIALGATPPPLSFWHWYSTEGTYDGGVLEISTNNGTSWIDAKPNIILGGYTGTMDATTLLSGRTAWTGSSNNKFIKTKVNMQPYANQSVKIRFRFTSDVGTNLEGWYVDDIAIKDQAVVEMRSSLFNSAGARVMVSDSIAIILPPLPTCVSAGVTTQPLATTVCTGSNASFSVVASGTSVSYQWQLSTDGGVNFVDISSATSATLTLTSVSAIMNNNRYRVLISNACPSNFTSDAAILTVNNPASITGQPAATAVCEGSNTSFTVTATGTAISFQWQVSTDGGTTYTDIASATSATLSLNAVTAAMNNNRYRAVVSSCGPAGVNSSDAILTVNSPASIGTQPANTTVCSGTDANFTVITAGTGVTYQWQVSTNGGTSYTAIPGANSATLTVPAVTAGLNNNLYQVIINGTCPGATTSTGALLTVSNTASITTQPASVVACAGNNASITAVASGSTYQWQVSTDGGTTYTDIPSATTTTLSLNNVTSAMNNNKYRLVVFSCSAAGLNSTAATLTVNDPAVINTQPANTIACIGSDVTLTVNAGGTALNYQWEMSTDGGISYNSIPGAITNSLLLSNVTAAMANNLYRVVLSNTCTVNFTSNAALLSITDAPVISAQPSSTPSCANSLAGFNVTATGVGLTYQWQVSTDGGVTFTNINGETGVSLSISPALDNMNGNQYRAIVFNSCSSTGVVSDPAILTVNPLPVVSISANPYQNIAENMTTTLTATSTPASTTFSWYKEGVLIPSATGSTITVNHSDLGEYTARVTDANTCTNVSNTLVIGDSSLNFAFITPNPNRGQFQVRFRAAALVDLNRMITIYDAKGARVYSKKHISTNDKMDVSLDKVSKGTYVLILSDSKGNTLATGKFVVQ